MRTCGSSSPPRGSPLRGSSAGASSPWMSCTPSRSSKCLSPLRRSRSQELDEVQTWWPCDFVEGLSDRYPFHERELDQLLYCHYLRSNRDEVVNPVKNPVEEETEEEECVESLLVLLAQSAEPVYALEEVIARIVHCEARILPSSKPSSTSTPANSFGDLLEQVMSSNASSSSYVPPFRLAHADGDLVGDDHLDMHNTAHNAKTNTNHDHDTSRQQEQQKLEEFLEGMAGCLGRRGPRQSLHILYDLCTLYRQNSTMINGETQSKPRALAQDLITLPHRLCLAAAHLAASSSTSSSSCATAEEEQVPMPIHLMESLLRFQASPKEALGMSGSWEDDSPVLPTSTSTTTTTNTDMTHNLNLMDPAETMISRSVFVHWANETAPQFATALPAFLGHVAGLTQQRSTTTTTTKDGVSPSRVHASGGMPLFAWPVLGEQQSPFFHVQHHDEEDEQEDSDGGGGGGLIRGEDSSDLEEDDKKAADFASMNAKKSMEAAKKELRLFYLASMAPELGGKWHRLYSHSTNQSHEQASATRLYTSLLGYDGPTLTLLRATSPSSSSSSNTTQPTECIFGAFATSPWKDSKDFFGNADSFLFRLEPYVSVYRPRETSLWRSGGNYMYCHGRSKDVGFGSVGLGGGGYGSGYGVRGGLSGYTTGFTGYTNGGGISSSSTGGYGYSRRPSNSSTTSNTTSSRLYGIGFGGDSNCPRLFIPESSLQDHPSCDDPSDEESYLCIASSYDTTYECGPLLHEDYQGPTTVVGEKFVLQELEVWAVGGEEVIAKGLRARDLKRQVTESNLRKARTVVDKAGFLDDFTSGLIESKVWAHRAQARGRAEFRVDDRHGGYVLERNGFS